MLNLVGVMLEECDLSNSEWEASLLEEVALKGCRMTGFRLRGGRAIELAMSDCQGQYAQMEGVEMKGARFATCAFNDSSFIRCNLAGARFSDCDLRNVVLDGSRMKGADLRGCRIDGLRASLDDLSGAVLDPRQAAAVVYAQAQISVLEIGEAVPDWP